jgi:hypothetical protein
MFYTFNQNNTGGSFNYDEREGISHYVIVEAETPADANDRARDIGLYFDGVEAYWDCSCCGDRWYRASSYDESATPEVYGEPAETFTGGSYGMKWMKGYEGFIHYADGRVQGFWGTA